MRVSLVMFCLCPQLIIFPVLLYNSVWVCLVAAVTLSPFFSLSNLRALTVGDASLRMASLATIVMDSLELFCSLAALVIRGDEGVMLCAEYILSCVMHLR